MVGSTRHSVRGLVAGGLLVESGHFSFLRPRQDIASFHFRGRQPKTQNRREMQARPDPNLALDLRLSVCPSPWPTVHSSKCHRFTFVPSLILPTQCRHNIYSKVRVLVQSAYLPTGTLLPTRNIAQASLTLLLSLISSIVSSTYFSTVTSNARASCSLFQRRV